MFDTLVESGSHTEDVKRKGSFMLGTLIIYGVILLAIAVGSIMLAVNNVNQQNLELISMVAPPPAAEPPPAPKQQEQPKQQVVQDKQVATRTELVANTLDPTKVPKEVKSEASRVPPVPPGGAVLGKSNTDPVGAPSSGPPSSGVVGGGGPPAPVDEPPPPPKPKPTPTPPPKPSGPISGGVLNGKAISKPAPPYPPIAKAARQQGTVVVQITVDESGRVISAKAISGPPLLLAAAQQAAMSARFSPTLLSGQPVKVTGTITYNFQLQ